MRKLLVFGNGLGRALDNEYFSLNRALEYAWNDAGVLNETQKTLIKQCLPQGVLEDDLTKPPSIEEELDRLQRVLSACDEISKHEVEGGEDWLNSHGKQFPGAIRSYVHSAACYFHQSESYLPEDFIKSLRNYILGSRSHVATLNYDELLYRAFIGSELMQGYSCLLDGFVGEFAPEKLDRYRPENQCYYLHLHGSPLYYSTEKGELRKASLGDIPALHGYSSTHIVLTHVNHKISVINSSPILREYWRRLKEAIREADSILLFGYGGADDHLNQMIANLFTGKELQIVERKHPSYDTVEGKKARFEFWSARIGSHKKIAFWLEDILSFRKWGYEHKWE